MKLWIGITDDDWFRFLSARPELDELNFWQPSGSRAFRALSPGEPFLFKLHAPNHFVVGGGFFARHSVLPVELAWDAFAEKNGAASLGEMRRRVAHYRKLDPDSRESFMIGCIILVEPFFLNRDQWIAVPSSFSRHVQQGKGYDAGSGDGRRLWNEVQERLQADIRFRVAEADAPMWGSPVLVRQRLGQGGFRVLVTENYERQCAVTRERALPVLEAAHIRPVSKSGKHRVDNGMLLRSDVHKLFDNGYLTISPDHRLRVSSRLKKEFDNGEHYYRYDGSKIWVPPRLEDQPSREFLEWHADTMFRA